MTEQLTLAPGDHVVYPKHGAGVVLGVTERTALGQTQAYYNIELLGGGMQVLVPVGKALTLGLRRVTHEQEIPGLLAHFAEPDMDLPPSFPQRIRLEQTILESGNIADIARLLATLSRRHVMRGLADSEHAVLRQARQVLVVEVAVSLGVPEQDAARLVDERLN
ncbi:CarD family transcriptional regulator [Deinococcus pimensis]|uniref:CarD family transcriptional regulator n=1 Tax=Deinococcus pimensis TaxID=309888 RepID=UPI00048860F0|nr:CarD family transcriptional regulator [Deinococcus pimensis]